ncbi:MAG: Flp pilus assembly complex ATPase component TadA [Anaerolineae bacterium]|nr:Flp pilus assembly complex ATPase component TadA [Anaerolineae bacterium]
MTSPESPSDGRSTPFSPLVPGRSGRPTYSLEALRERVERQFQAETAGRDDILDDLTVPDDRRALLAEITDYVLAVESITLDGRSRAALIEAAYASLFTFGPLDTLIDDDAVTEIAVDGPDTIAARRGLGRLERVAARFDDAAHLARVTERLLALGESGPLAEALIAEQAVSVQGRRARISAVMPPVSAAISVQLRLHPRQPITLDALHAPLGTLPAEAAMLLRAIVGSGWGALIAGEKGLGKTTLAGALAALLPAGAQVIAVERAAELPLPETVARETVSAGRSFADALRAAYQAAPDWLLVDELRGDEQGALWAALEHPPGPRGLWVWRGASQPERLRSALNMAIRRDNPALPQSALDAAWAAHFPFVVALRMAPDGARLAYLAETRLAAGELRIAPLIERRDGGWRRTGERPIHALDVPREFSAG